MGVKKMWGIGGKTPQGEFLVPNWIQMGGHRFPTGMRRRIRIGGISPVYLRMANKSLAVSAIGVEKG